MNTDHPLPEVDLSFQHLQLEFARLDILLHRQIQRQQHTTTPQSDARSAIGSFHISDAQAYTLLQRPFGHGWDALEAEAAEPYEQALAQTDTQISALLSHAEQIGERLRLHQLARLLGLDRFALNVLLVSIAPSLDSRYGKLYGYLQDDLTRKRPSISLMLDLLCPSGPERLLRLSHFADDAPLLRYRLVERVTEPGAGRSLLINESICPDDSIVTWLLLGKYQPNDSFNQHLSFQPVPNPNLELLSPDFQGKISSTAAKEDILVFHDRDFVTQQAAAHFLAVAAERSLLFLDLESGIAAGITPLAAVRLLLRDALLTNAIPHISGWDHCLTDDAPPADLLTLLCQHPGLLIISGQKRWQPRSVARTRRFRWFTFPVPGTARRQQLLQHFLIDDAATDDLNLTSLAGQFLLTTGQLRDLVNSARDMAAQESRPLMNHHLYAAARAHSNPRLETQARKITPRYVWDDLILPDEQITVLHELVDTVRSRPLVLEEWGVGRKLTSSAGVTVLFFGPPGTGKTMAAEVIAGELGFDLYKIDLSGVVSKYIGETEKNLERIFSEAESSNAILFFDEADAIFGKRSEVKDAHDRYANIEVSYLLQRMEAHNGVTILSTNMRANLDEAFMRRLQFALDFPFPRAKDRLRIWQTLFPPDVPRDQDLDLKLLADRFEIAGGNIRNIIVSATYLAATNGQLVTMEHMLHGTRRELQKMGRLVDEADLEIKE
jgi:ATP-dependent 26S proteasome regulatory subunit